MAGSVLRRSAPKPVPKLDPVYTAEEVAEFLSVTAPTVKRWMTDGLIRYVELPKGRRIKASQLDEFLESRTVEPS